MTQVPLPEHDHMVKVLPTDRADQTLRIAAGSNSLSKAGGKAQALGDVLNRTAHVQNE